MILLSLGLFCARGAAATGGTCEPRLAGVARLFPWPAPAPEMLDVLRVLARTTDADLDAALAQPSPDLTVRALLAPATIAEIRVIYGDAAGPKPTTLRRDPRGSRAALARTVAGIRDGELRAAWMTFLKRDPVRGVRLIATEAFLALDDEAARDAFALGADVDETERRVRALAARADLGRLSPRARWEIIKFLVPFYERRDDVLIAGLESLGNPVLKRWYRDQLRGRTIYNVLKNYDQNPLNEKMRRYRAQELGQVLNSIGNASYRRFALDELERVAEGVTPIARLAHEALAWESVWESIYRGAAARACGLDHDAVTRAALERDAPDAESLARALRVKAEYEQRTFVPRDAYTDADLAAFEASLR